MDSFIPATPPSPPMTASTALIHRIDQLLPQTQCRRCGYDDCHAYAQAIASGEAAINRCPPGSDATIAALSQLLGRPALPLAGDLDPMPVRHVVHIDPLHCIGCTKCILAYRCTGCELCLPPCPVDCISLVPVQQPWQDADASHGRRHHLRREHRLQARRPATRPAAPAAARPINPSIGTETAERPKETGGARIQAEAGRAETASRDPNIALASTDEKARRLAAIRARMKPAHPRPATE